MLYLSEIEFDKSYLVGTQQDNVSAEKILLRISNHRLTSGFQLLMSPFVHYTFQFHGLIPNLCHFKYDSEIVFLSDR